MKEHYLKPTEGTKKNLGKTKSKPCSRVKDVERRIFIYSFRKYVTHKMTT